MIYKVEIQARKWFNKIKGLGVEIELNLTNVTYQLLASQLQPEKKPDRKFQGFFFFFFIPHATDRMSDKNVFMQTFD